MNLSIFTTVSNPQERGDNWQDAIDCYLDLADELVVVDGNYTDPHPHEHGKLKIVDYKWEKEFSWEFIGQQFQRGYEACTGDIVIHSDIDFIWHENNFTEIRKAAQDMVDRKLPAMSMWKHQFILPDRYNLKSRLVVMVNKKEFGDRIRFDSGGDLCQPSLDGIELKPDNVPEARIPFYCYEKLLKNEAQIKDDVGRMARAWQKYFGGYKLGGPDNEDAYKEWLHMSCGRFNKPQKHILLKEHPKYIQDTISNLKPENWGWNGFNNLEKNDYVQK